MAGPRSRVVGVLLTYFPDPETLEDALAAATGEVDELVVVDNGSTATSRRVIEDARERAARREPPGRGTVRVIANERNEGVAVAFNQGMRLALEGRADFVLLLDQDSAVRSGCVQRLLDGYRALSGRFRVGALQATNLEPGARVLLNARMLDYYRRRGGYSDPTARQGLLLLNSGALIPTDVLREVGLMDETFFADLADYEFSLRLAARGLSVFHIPDALVDHNRGPSRSPSPVRLYYGVRELVRLASRYWRSNAADLAPVLWTTANRVGSDTLRSGHPLRIAGLALRAVFDGLLGVHGEFKGPTAPGPT